MPNFNTHVQTSFADHILSYIERVFLDRLVKELVLEQFAMPKKLSAHSGNTVKWNRWDNPTGSTDAIGDGVSPDGISLTSAKVEATASQYGQFAATSDRLQLVAINDTMEDMSELLGYAAALSRDMLARNELDTNGTQRYADSANNSSKANVESGADKLLSLELRQVLKAFRVANVPAFSDGLYKGVIHPIMEFDLLSETTSNGFILLAAQTSNEAQVKGEIGTAYGIKLYRSTNIRADATSTHVYGNIFLGNKAFGSVSIEGGNLEMIVHETGSAGTEDPLNQRATVGYKFWAVYKVLEALRAQIVWAYGA